MILMLYLLAILRCKLHCARHLLSPHVHRSVKLIRWRLGDVRLLDVHCTCGRVYFDYDADADSKPRK